MSTDEQTQFMELLSEQHLEKADAIVLLAGDRYHRVAKAAELYRAGYAPRIVLTSNADNWDYGSLPSGKLVPALLECGVPEEDIIWEETAPHTRAEADRTLQIAAGRGWKTLLVVTTEYHQYRAFLTWLRAMKDQGLDLTLIMSSVEEFPDFYTDTREDALAREFTKIAEYGAKGDVASIDEGIDYLTRQAGVIH